MTLEAAFSDLSLQLHRLREAVVGLRTTAVEDRPLRGEAVLVDLMGDTAEAALGWLEEAIAACREARRATEYPLDLDRARRSLATVQDRYTRAFQRLSYDLLRYERVAELVRLGQERGGEWQAWAAGVREGLDWCQQPLFEASQALARCWQEVAERVGMTSLSVQTTNIATVPGRAETTP